MEFIIQATIRPDVLSRLRGVISGMGSAAASDAMTTVIKDVTLRMRELAIGQTPVGVEPKPIIRKRGKSRPDDNARMKSRWSDVVPVDGGFAFSNPATYGYVLEYGLYKSKGPRTVEGTYAGQKSDNWNASGIFSSQASSGILGPLEANDTASQAATYIVDTLMSFWEKMSL